MMDRWVISKSGIGLWALACLVLTLPGWSVPEDKSGEGHPCPPKAPCNHQDQLIENRQLEGSVASRGVIRLKNVQMNGNVYAGESLTVEDSSIGGNVKVGGRTEIMNSQVRGNVSIGKTAKIEATDITGNLSVRESASIHRLKLQSGTLATSSIELILRDSKVRNVRMTHRLTSHLYTKTAPGLENTIEAAPGSAVTSRGYQVHADSERTTVITPEGGVFINGNKTHGHGENTYAEYRRRHPKSPAIKGPGWPGQIAQGSGSATAIRQVLKLSRGTEVSGQVTFDSGQGLVVIEKGARLLGNVEGGTVAYR